eukprot:7488318-Heterocapsa_arctica.AAC.1
MAQGLDEALLVRLDTPGLVDIALLGHQPVAASVEPALERQELLQLSAEVQVPPDGTSWPFEGRHHPVAADPKNGAQHPEEEAQHRDALGTRLLDLLGDLGAHVGIDVLPTAPWRTRQ